MKTRKSKAGKPPSLSSLLSSSFHFQGDRNLMPLLKCLYIVITKSLSLGVKQGIFESEAVVSTPKCELEDTFEISRLLFEELRRKLSFHSNVDVENSSGEVLLLLRCSILMLQFHPHDQILYDNIQVVVSLVRRLSYKTIDSLNFDGCLLASFSDKSIPESPDSSACLLQRILEVYLDELFADRPLHAHLAISNFASATLQNRSGGSALQSRSSSRKVDIVLEIIAAHFLLSVSRHHSVESFLEGLVWTKKSVISYPELCLTVGLSLINHSVVMSSTVLLRSHLISLVSDVIGIRFFPEKADLGVRNLQLHLSAFNDSVILYIGHMSKFLPASCFQRLKPEKIVHRSFESHFNSEVYKKLNCVCAKLNLSRETQIADIPDKVMSSIVIDAICYVETNAYIVDASSRDHVIILLSSLITIIASDGVNESLMQGIKAMTLSDCCLLASIMKLMSCSLLQANNYFQNRLSCSRTILERNDAHYNSLSGIMSCFADFSILPVKAQQFIADSLEPIPSTYDEHKLMFVHFASVLSLCMFGGLDVVVRGCLFLMLALMNTLNLKDECTDSLRSSITSAAECPSHGSFPANCKSDVTDCTNFDPVSKISKRKLCSKVASNFQRTRQLLLSQQAADVSAVRTCDGEAYLKLVIDNANDIADLKDFVVCEEGKDYETYVKVRGKYRFKKFQKLRKQQQQKKRKLCELLKSLKCR